VGNHEGGGQKRVEGEDCGGKKMTTIEDIGHLVKGRQNVDAGPKSRWGGKKKGRKEGIGKRHKKKMGVGGGEKH